ncbi:MAG TPA: hypothetical protein VNQ73_12295 [Ilumatobacter sp.]|nr:hypothetical protein [Ilumatobacter sp.]
MHTLQLLDASMFEVEIDGAASPPDSVFPDWNVHDRFGIVIHEPLGGVGASHLIQLAIVAFYAASERRRGELTVYPNICAFHVGRGHGPHADFDFWPARREVIVPDDSAAVLSAINDRAITRLAVPDGAGLNFKVNRKEWAAALDHVTTAYAYGPGGRVAGGDVMVRGTDPCTEINPERVLRGQSLQRLTSMVEKLDGRTVIKEADPEYLAFVEARSGEVTDEQRAMARAARDAVTADGVVAERYRRLTIPDALRMLVPAR